MPQMSEVFLSVSGELHERLSYGSRESLRGDIDFKAERQLQQRSSWKNLYEEQYGDKNILVVDSHSASCGETQIALKLMELEEQGLTFAEITKKIRHFRNEMHTYFVLDNLETLRKNGRLTGIKAVVASTLSIKPVMAAEDGIIVQRGQGIGIKKALNKMVDLIASELTDADKKRIIISHCNAPDRALLVEQIIKLKTGCNNIMMQDMAGISSMYANDGGVIVAV